MATVVHYDCVRCLQAAFCCAVCTACWSALTPRTNSVVYVRSLGDKIGDNNVVVSGTLPVLAVKPDTLVRE